MKLFIIGVLTIVSLMAQDEKSAPTKEAVAVVTPQDAEIARLKAENAKLAQIINALKTQLQAQAAYLQADAQIKALEAPPVPQQVK